MSDITAIMILQQKGQHRLLLFNNKIFGDPVSWYKQYY